MSGHVRRRGARSWELKYDVPHSNKRRQIRYRSFKGTRRQAEAELARSKSPMDATSTRAGSRWPSSSPNGWSCG
jgi:hypothetical protein